MYRGLVPQLCGIAPEKAIKMTTNDAVRNYFTDPKTGEIPFSGELIAGAAVSGLKMYRVIFWSYCYLFYWTLIPKQL